MQAKLKKIKLQTQIYSHEQQGKKENHNSPCGRWKSCKVQHFGLLHRQLDIDFWEKNEQHKTSDQKAGGAEAV